MGDDDGRRSPTNGLPKHLSGPDLEQVALGPLTCIASEHASTDTSALPDVTDPVPGQVFFYVFRDDVAPVPGDADLEESSYGLGSGDDPRIPGPGDCP